MSRTRLRPWTHVSRLCSLGRVDSLGFPTRDLTRLTGWFGVSHDIKPLKPRHGFRPSLSVPRQGPSGLHARVFRSGFAFYLSFLPGSGPLQVGINLGSCHRPIRDGLRLGKPPDLDLSLRERYRVQHPSLDLSWLVVFVRGQGTSFTHLA